MGLKEGVDPRNLAQAGWGAILAANADPALEEALQPLLALRREQAGRHFRLYKADNGFRVGHDTKSSFLARQGVGPGPADPERVPYYLLLVGSPNDIPYRFQVQLDVQYAVGRIYFETLDEYAAYATSVVRAEREGVHRPRRMVIFGPTHADDVQTQNITDLLIHPLLKALGQRTTSLQFESVLGSAAHKQQLINLLGNKVAPTLLLTAGHGLAFPATDTRYYVEHGAILCADWPGPRQGPAQPLAPDFYFSAQDVDPSMQVHGMIAFHYSSYSAGVQSADENTTTLTKQAAPPSATSAPPLVARLAQRLLAQPKGGALAVVGLIDQARGYAIPTMYAQKLTMVFESSLRRLLDGYPVGLAMEYCNTHYAELSTILSSELEEIQFGKRLDALTVAGLWTANSDARTFAIVGDPAVHLTGSQY